MLFNFMAKDIVFELEKVGDSTCLGAAILNALFYTDHLVVIASSKAELKEKVDIITTAGGLFGLLTKPSLSAWSMGRLS